MSADVVSQKQPLQSTSKQKWPGMVEFYTGRDVMITGGTGLMGKCLVEKLLRSVPNGGRIFVLVRPKKGKEPKERIADLTASKVFEKIRTDFPDALDRLVPVSGDISKERMGLSEEDEALLVENVAVVLHLAATVQFNAPLRDSLKMNVIGTRSVMNLCKKMKKLESFVHVSTAYCNCHKNEMDEIVYSPTVPYDQVLGLLEWMSDEQLELITPSLREGRPNTYTFTKALAEHMLIREAGDLPLTILRPSIVGAAYSEPYPGWIDTIYGPAGLFVAVGKGLLRVLRCDPFSIADFVPVDFANNMLLAVGWVNAMHRVPNSQPIVYHYTSGSVNPIDWYRMYYATVKAYTNNPFDQVFRRPHVVQCWPMSLWPLYQFFLHYAPGYLADLMLIVMGKKPRIISIYKRINKAVTQLDYFIQRSWKWSHGNYDKLLSLMSEEDLREFNFDLKSMDWDVYIDRFCMGTKKYLLKEDVANLPSARRQITRLRNIRYTFNILMFLLATRLVYIRSQLAREVWSSFLSIILGWLTKLGLPLLHPSS